MNRIRNDWQRSQRGWARRDLWSMDGYICELLGGMIAEMRKEAHSHPCNPDGKYASCGSMPDGGPCGCEHDWNDTLDTIAEPLLAYKTRWDYLPRETTDQHVKREEKVVANAQAALRKIADVLPSLWD